MTNVLFLLGPTPAEYGEFAPALRAEFPALNVVTVPNAAEAARQMCEIDVLMTFGAQLRDEVLQDAPRLSWIQSLGSGVDGIVDAPLLSPNTVVTNIRGIHGPPVSEAALAAMFALSRSLPRSLAAQAQRHWDRFSPGLLDGRVVGILGVGTIAESLAPRCKALGMRVVGISASPRVVPHFDEVRSRDPLAAATSDLDYLVVLTPRTPETQGIVDARVLHGMKPGSFLINVARAGIVDEGALLTALQNGPLAGAALDVFDREPLAPDHPFWSCGNLIITPHLAGTSRDYPARCMPQIIENMRRFLAGGAASLPKVVRPTR